ncbi:hypothetical protein G6F57_014172 [Rhizopus arrhizus]|nr:hypothetical protein G6F57_014172 [Rhizopus arrhizus]
MRRSIQPDIGALHDLGPTRALTVEELGKLRRIAGHDLGALFIQLRLHVGLVDDLRHQHRQALGHRIRRRNRRHHALPRAGLESLDALFGNGRDVGHQLHAFALGNGDRPQLARLDVRQGRQQPIHDHLGLPADRIRHRLRTALVRHVIPVGARGLLHRHRGQVRRAADRGHGEIQALRLRQRHESLDGSKDSLV